MINRQLVLHALGTLDSLRAQLENGLQGEGAVIAPYCLREKLDLLNQTVRLMGSEVDEVTPRQRGDAR